MHVGQLLLVEAESHGEARDKVESVITHSEVPTPSWSDWHEIGGRWADTFGKDKYILRYTENQKLAEERIQDWLAGRKAEMNRMLEEVKTFDLAAYAETYDPEASPKYGDDSMKLYYLKKIVSVLDESWTSDSGVYDMETWTTNLKYFRERLAIAPEMQYIVVVDFHF